MPSLVDIAPLREQVQIRGVSIDVFGLSAENIAEILYRFPELRMMLIRMDPGGDVVGQLMSRVPEALALVCAAGCGARLGNADSERIVEAARGLTIGEQYAIIEKMLVLTFPQGISRFLEGVQGLLAQADDARGRAPDTKSPAQSNSALSTGATSESAGDQRLAS